MDSNKQSDLTDIPVKRLNDLDELFKHVHTDKNADDPYLRGLNNGVILGHATIFDHEPEYIEAVEKPQSETGWVIENLYSSPAKPQYFAGLNGKRASGLFTQWDTDHMKAIRFARKEDAEAMGMENEVRICEHTWG